MTALRDFAVDGLREARAELLVPRMHDLSYSLLRDWIDRHASAIRAAEQITGSSLSYNLRRQLWGHKQSTAPDILDAVRGGMVERLDQALITLGGGRLMIQDSAALAAPTHHQLPALDAQSAGMQAMLAALVEAARTDPAQLRRLVYEAARSTLERQVAKTVPPLTPAEIVEGTRALEAAIASVEAGASGEHAWLRQIHGPVGWEQAADAPTDAARRERQHLPRRRWLRPAAWSMIVLVGAAGLGLALSTRTEVATDGAGVRAAEPLDDPARQGSAPPPTADHAPAAVASQLAGLPVPITYGVYAVSKGKLHELQTLPIRVPDARVLVSADITTPSQTILPDGDIAFILYRRELVNNAPDKMSVRVIARVARDLTFAAGKAATTNVSGSWRIRSNAVALRVAPVAASSEMIVVRPESGFSFPAGRYALVYNGQGYDFTVDGPVVTAAHCLERVEATNGNIYTECRNPRF